MPVAKDTLLLGHHGQLNAGDEVPAAYLDSLGNEQPTDFERLEALGLVEQGPKVAATIRRPRTKRRG